MSHGDYLTSSEIARLLGISPATVRRWTESGVLPAARTAGGHRRFAREDVERLAREQAADAGRTDRWIRSLLEDRPLVVDTQLLSERHVTGAWSKVAGVLGPVITELGRLWEMNSLSILQEHLASTRLLAGLMRAADGIPVGLDGPHALLATPPGERHTLGLALAALCFREHGWRTSTAGGDLPDGELAQAAVSGDYDALVLSASVHSQAEVLLRVALAVGEPCSRHGVAFVVGGEGPWPEPFAHGARMHGFRELDAWLVQREDRRGLRRALRAGEVGRPTEGMHG